MNKKIVKRVAYAIEVQLASPINTSSGITERTDKDVLKNSNGEYFIPGTSIAGALRARLSAEEEKNLTGYSKDDEGKMSSLFISDLYFDNGEVIVRDGVKLTSEKTVKDKFDYEAVQTGATGKLYLSYVIREGEEDLENIIKKLLVDIDEGFIRFGSNKSRGYGQVKIAQVYRSEFSKDNVAAYLDFDRANLDGYQTSNTYETWKNTVSDKSDDFVKIIVPLKLEGGISIRKYSAKLNEADYEQITIFSGDKEKERPVIPGTSWNGAIRADVSRILKELGDSKADKDVSEWFGYIKDEDHANSSKSIVTIGESIIEDSKPLTLTRNKINRFDASTYDGALYTERSYFTGKTTLEILVKKDIERHYEALIGALQIVIKDIENGFVAIGGQTSVGKGLFSSDDSKKIEYVNGDEDIYPKALYTFLEGK